MLERFASNIKQGYKEASNFTHKTIDESKRLTYLAMYNSELKKLYSELGELYYKEVALNEPMLNAKKIIAKIENTKQHWEDKLNRDVNEPEDCVKEVKYTSIDKHKPEFKFCHKCNIGNSITATQCEHCGATL
ncbi:hypothetical protein AN639_03170 [Candidatus Epulonipiscium fishelsonii]|uniref:Uncharacterized protein n=1 Tax=Candidatus Epulonipiscium fishelsonii TaxID=77094 RepID=A0ACC8XGR7_9FIRM|nr:hypothetical protein AN639_03170 [Epulopiscium sp. SCG-B05WGA-EpuloA1]ONI42617.1 hypothetical protein AN396_13625 [Epulopiscium sp. SCG-B11WGA-EpuloA1]